MLVFSLSLGSGTKRLNLQKIGANTGGKWGGGVKEPLCTFSIAK